MRGRGEMPGAAFVPRERLVRDMAHEVLQEAVLAVLGRPRVGLDRSTSLRTSEREQRLDRVRVEPGERAERRRA